MKVRLKALEEKYDPLVAADTVNDKVLPFYEEQEVKLLRILTDRGSEYKGSAIPAIFPKQRNEYARHMISLSYVSAVFH